MEAEQSQAQLTVRLVAIVPANGILESPVRAAKEPDKVILWGGSRVATESVRETLVVWITAGRVFAFGDGGMVARKCPSRFCTVSKPAIHLRDVVKWQ